MKRYCQHYHEPSARLLSRPLPHCSSLLYLAHTWVSYTSFLRGNSMPAQSQVAVGQRANQVPDPESEHRQMIIGVGEVCLEAGERHPVTYSLSRQSNAKALTETLPELDYSLVWFDRLGI